MIQARNLLRKYHRCFHHTQYPRFCGAGAGAGAGAGQRRSVSSSSITLNQQKKQASMDKQKVLSKTIYKQIMRWTAITGTDVPFDKIPPLTLVPPRVDATALQTLSDLHLQHDTNLNSKEAETTTTNHDGQEDHDCKKLTLAEQHLLTLMKGLPPNSIIEPNQLILPIENANHVKSATRVAYALNNFTTEEESKADAEQMKERVSLGFEVLKSLNQLSDALEARKKMREDHWDREGVAFRVGQVVQHKKNRWRAIVGGWTKTPAAVDAKEEPSHKTSLTNRSYTDKWSEGDVAQEDIANVEAYGNGTNVVEYVVHLDEGDAAHSRVRVVGSMKVKQHELQEVVDADLKRIRNSHVGHHFESFNTMTGLFVPGKTLNYEYPADEGGAMDNTVEESKHMMAKHENAKKILHGVKEIAAQLHRIILDTSSCAEARKLHLLPGIQKKLEQVVTGNFEENIADKIQSPVSSSHKIAIQHTRALFFTAFQITDMLWQRNNAEKNSELKIV